MPPPMIMEEMRVELKIKDDGCNTRKYIRQELTQVWSPLRKTQQAAKKIRTNHLEVLAAHYANTRNSTRIQEMTKLKHSEQIRSSSTKHKWYLREWHGTIRSILVPDYRIQKISSVVGMIAMTTLMAMTPRTILRQTPHLQYIKHYT